MTLYREQNIINNRKYKFFIEDLLRGDSSRVYLATSDFLMAGIEDVSDEDADKPNYEWIGYWQQVIDLHPEMIRLAYVTPPYCSRALPDTMPFWHGFMSQLHYWDENDGVCFYYEAPQPNYITAATNNTDNFIVIDNKDIIKRVDSRGLGLSLNTGAVRYLHTDGSREVDYILWNGWEEGGNLDKLFLLNQLDPEDHPRMGTDNVNSKALNDQVTSFQPWIFNIISVLVLMNEDRPYIDDVKFEHILADSSYKWITEQAVNGTPPNETPIFNGVYYDLLGENAIDRAEAINAADASGINDFLQTQRDKFGDSYYFGGNSQQVDDISMSVMSTFDAITAGEIDRPERFDGDYYEHDRLLQELHSALIAKRIYDEEGSNDVPFNIIWDDHGGKLDASPNWDRNSNTMAWHRMSLAIATIFDGIHSVKKGSYFFENQDCWMDEYAVDDGNAVRLIAKVDDEWQFVTDWQAKKYWLGAPTGLIITQGQELTTTNLITNPSFEDGTTSWSSQNVIATQDGTYYTEGSYSVKLVPDGEPARFYQSGITLTATNYYTFSFDMKSSANRELHFVISHLDPVVSLIDHDKIAVGKSWTTYTSTFRVPQGQTNNNYYFGFNIDGQGDPVWIDNCKLQEGQGFYGYSRKYLNGWVGVNLTGGDKVFTVPGTGYQKIAGDVDPNHNDGSSVGTTLTIGGMDAYFLFKPD